MESRTADIRPFSVGSQTVPPATESDMLPTGSKFMIHIRIRLILLFVLLIPFASFAQVKGTVVAKKLNIYEEPNSKSEVLTSITKGKPVTVLGRNGGWAKVKVKLDRSFTFTGWANAKAISWKGTVPIAKYTLASQKPAAPVAARPVVTRPTPVPTMPPPPPAARADLDNFFAPTPAPQVARSAPPRSFEPTPKPASDFREPSMYGGSSNDNFRIGLDVGYVLYHYKLANGGATPSAIFSYNLPGFGFALSSTYWYMEGADSGWRLGADVGLNYNLYKFSTNLASGGATTTLKSSATSIDGLLKFPAELRFGEKKGLRLGGSLGFEYLKFNANDVENGSGPLNLYVSSTTMSVLAGVYAKIPVSSFLVSIGSDVMLLSMVSESPKNQTGTSPSGKFGYTPELVFSWVPSESHQLDLGYKLRFQKYSFSGTGSRLASSNVTSGQVESALHDIFVGYNYHF
jgi:hypothetical protein